MMLLQCRKDEKMLTFGLLALSRLIDATEMLNSNTCIHSYFSILLLLSLYEICIPPIIQRSQCNSHHENAFRTREMLSIEY